MIQSDGPGISMAAEMVAGFCLPEEIRRRQVKKDSMADSQEAFETDTPSKTEQQQKHRITEGITEGIADPSMNRPMKQSMNSSMKQPPGKAKVPGTT